MTLLLHGIGAAVPAFQVDQDDAKTAAVPLCCSDEQQTRVLARFFERCGVRTRGSVVLETDRGPVHQRQSFFVPSNGKPGLGPTTAQRMRQYERHAERLALQASQDALQLSRVGASELTHLVTVSCSGFHAPGVDVSLIQHLGLPPTTQRTHIGFMGCHGALNGLRVADAILGSDPTARVLLCAVELCSLHFQYGWDPEKILANALFADGAAALVGTVGDASDANALRLVANGSCLIPSSTDAMTWCIGDHGFEMTLSRQVPVLIEKHLGEWTDAWLANIGVRRSDVGSWIVHPGGPKILDAVEKALGLNGDALEESRQVLAEHGNMSSPTVLFILGRMLRRRAPRPIVAMGFGPGLTVEAAFFQ